MKEPKKFRDNGAIGALLDEYERAIVDLKSVIAPITTDALIAIVDATTKDEDCRSIQTILSHVVGSGYTYVIEIRKWLGEDVAYKEKELLSSVEEYISALDKMFAYNEKLFQDHPNLQLEEFHTEKKMTVRWGQKYDPEQILEHAIVHILRHRRQIERFLVKSRRYNS